MEKVLMEHPQGHQVIHHIGTTLQANAEGLFEIERHMVDWAKRTYGMIEHGAAAVVQEVEDLAARAIGEGKTLVQHADGTLVAHEPGPDVQPVEIHMQPAGAIMVRAGGTDDAPLFNVLRADGKQLNTDPVDEAAGQQLLLDNPLPAPPVDAAGLRTDGPTLAEYVKAGYAAVSYPPAGYAAKPDLTTAALTGAASGPAAGPGDAAPLAVQAAAGEKVGDFLPDTGKSVPLVDGSNVVETVDPMPPLAPTAAAALAQVVADGEKVKNVASSDIAVAAAVTEPEPAQVAQAAPETVDKAVESGDEEPTVAEKSPAAEPLVDGSKAT